MKTLLRCNKVVFIRDEVYCSVRLVASGTHSQIEDISDDICVFSRFLLSFKMSVLFVFRLTFSRRFFAIQLFINMLESNTCSRNTSRVSHIYRCGVESPSKQITITRISVLVHSVYSVYLFIQFLYQLFTVVTNISNMNCEPPKQGRQTSYK